MKLVHRIPGFLQTIYSWMVKNARLPNWNLFYGETGSNINQILLKKLLPFMFESVIKMMKYENVRAINVR
jgi:hypothetical protein